MTTNFPLDDRSTLAPFLFAAVPDTFFDFVAEADALADVIRREAANLLTAGRVAFDSLKARTVGDADGPAAG